MNNFELRFGNQVYKVCNLSDKILIRRYSGSDIHISDVSEIFDFMYYVQNVHRKQAELNDAESEMNKCISKLYEKQGTERFHELDFYRQKYRQLTYDLSRAKNDKEILRIVKGLEDTQ